MAILNVTPDSFSDGGRFADTERAVAHGRMLAASGADIIDVGGESTRPGARTISAEEERQRVIPVIEELVAAGCPPVSIDTRRASVAEAALAAGAAIVNDVSAGVFDPAMLDTVAQRRAAYVAMHMQGEPETMQDHPHYDDVVAEVTAHLAARLQAAEEAGVAQAQLCADPGIGFGKTTPHNVALLQHLGEIGAELGIPLLIGTSRKRFLGTLARSSAPLEVAERSEATIASVVWSFAQGAAIVRVHDVVGAVRARQWWMRAREQSLGFGEQVGL